ncbi:MAG: Exopolyphosphatase [Rhodocyclaceae bacterium]|nr:MAG: exopolyphosphatase [Rhodocyclaceae bacterium]MBE7422412.1 exopolyphosphatase [Zoogloeaceae bacterium]MBV6407047.1 Exopolyphosphatase [Rhodocyclaceae bacterium]MCK6382770.1 exopolyphosphatase [Rhodocyclaceae bacterium]CAG0928763.1 exopolyphosphatase / guanosine-5'-triphosphate,3'-diphosphate pyrophosphatase [Rhodocyclaceae bacterium]
MGYELVAAVDLGSNSFRLQVGRVVDDQIYPLDSLKETVRLAAGLTAQKTLDGPSQLRALDALARFGERLRGFDRGAVRAVATNTLRVAKNAPQFLAQAEAALGFPIEIVAGREEARLIYLGVAHSLPNRRTRQLVVDIGGGSTEVIIGRDLSPIELESLYMGSVGFSLQYFPRGRIERPGMKAAELAARQELQAIVRQYRKTGWEQAVGSSGTAKALADILELNGLSESGITRDGLERLRALLLQAGDLGKLTLQGLRPDRIPVLPGGLAIMLAVFKEFGLERMIFSEGALRLGVLYDLLGRYHHQDLRHATVQQFMRRYQVDAGQASRAAATAQGFLQQLLPEAACAEQPEAQVLEWAARLHEIGISVAHSGYHKHSAYILANADMPGFSKMDQARLSRVVLAHRGKLERVQALSHDSTDWLLIFSLRLAVLLHRARDDTPLPAIGVKRSERGFTLGVDPHWLAASPLTSAALEEEGPQWAAMGMEFRIKARSGKSQAAA